MKWACNTEGYAQWLEQSLGVYICFFFFCLQDGDSVPHPHPPIPYSKRHCYCYEYHTILLTCSTLKILWDLFTFFSWTLLWTWGRGEHKWWRPQHRCMIWWQPAAVGSLAQWLVDHLLANLLATDWPLTLLWGMLLTPRNPQLSDLHVWHQLHLVNFHGTLLK